MRVLLVVNEKSRRGAREGAFVRSAFEALGIECEREANGTPVDAVVAAGGDGTVISTVPLAIERDVPLGIVPLGTFNDLARTLGVPLSVRAACEVIAAGATHVIDVGRVNGTYFVNEASVGLSTRIARRQTPQIKQRFGILAVIATTLQCLRALRFFTVRLTYGEGMVEQFKTVQLTIANNARFGGILQRLDASIDDGWLDLYSVEPRNWLQALGVAQKVLARDPSSGEGLRTRRAARFEVETGHAHHIAADGEPAGFTPAIFEIVPKAVRVLVPKAPACATERSDIRGSNSRPSDSVPG